MYLTQKDKDNLDKKFNSFYQAIKEEITSTAEIVVFHHELERMAEAEIYLIEKLIKKLKGE